MNVYEKLGRVQQELNAPKGQYNSFGRYSYRSCEDILKAVKPLLGEVKAALTISDALELVGERYYIAATATLTDIESGGQISVTARAREESEKKGMDASQVSGAAGSYARKYALNGLFCIDDAKDSDSTNEDEAKSGGMQPPGPSCEMCGNEIMPYNDGKKAYTAAEMAQRSKSMFGHNLCARCSKSMGKKAADAGEGG